ncbi:formate/nitrite transporter family protein [Hominisplanchenecus murintestinalis]|jgi:nitrite transporter NirC|uniref:Formate/nitrite transporter family protein n=1 Tax=Hominisplanchenecus murintestinalis TaxID=2941517 RepID=A0AC61R323_9FIRM|nr:formate/nitrite transporter family protein [Hominisplanchenecus murintestinalis]NBH97539.1 formate/nitrite transporter family protein [Lachnospiraceae bacterium]NBI74517.1 formate/nitrite transporter family protein [Lachnospiraceae bacterium]RKJ97695.1 formate/nitrite transporter family protein [Anaerotruncus sp. 1XD22-93]TGY00690.1 formate/nitrite transporter family protein [Hominisplanchenecus murintestinalis]
MFGDEFQAAGNAAKNKLGLLEKNPLGYVMSSIMAGLYIAFGSILMGVVGGTFTAGGAYSTKLVCGLVFSVGLCFVIMAGAELFTGNNFVMACGALKKEVSWGKAVKLWIVCYLGNLIGSVVGGGLFTLTGLATGDVGAFLANAAAAKIAGEPMQLFAKAILCNICVCLAVWCSIKMKTEGGKIAMAVAGVVTFVTCGFEHSIANMTFFTIGLLNPNGAAVNMGGCLYNLLIVTVGNMIGGILFVAVPYYLISKSKK